MPDNFDVLSFFLSFFLPFFLSFFLSWLSLDFSVSILIVSSFSLLLIHYITITHSVYLSSVCVFYLYFHSLTFFFNIPYALLLSIIIPLLFQSIPPFLFLLDVKLFSENLCDNFFPISSIQRSCFQRLIVYFEQNYVTLHVSFNLKILVKAQTANT